ncbi:solute carrier family 13 member 2-like [Pecten maximus]|uniref:solute carrier family 13 member 2-like n=1 Tax=Pecten maximus TaxID=6579 RepID=UPI001458A720|nr:solute carrier family 13 member 2-like [Pecten maximus]
MDRGPMTLRDLWTLRTLVFVVVASLVPIPLLINGTAESRCAYVMIVMALLWITEAIPIPVTSLLPVFMFPMLGVVPATDVCTKYINDTSMLFIGGLVIAVAVEEVNLHKRMALGIILVLGTQPNMLLLGLMLPTWFLSMWISNTAATSMMLPIIVAVVEQLRDMNVPHTKVGKDNSSFEPDYITHENCRQDQQTQEEVEETEDENHNDGGTMTDEQLVGIGKGFALCVAYSANIGGIATLTGTAPNLILQGQANSLYRSRKEGADSGITFANWMGFGVPLSVLLMFVAWVWLQIYCLRDRCCLRITAIQKARVKMALRNEYNKLGPLSFQEVVVIVLFAILVLLWLFRDIPNLGGWRFLFPDDPISGPFVRDSSAAIFIAVLLFILPSNVPRVLCCRQYTCEGKIGYPEYKPILDWKTTAQKIPWGIIVLLGGGFALADGSSVSGLSRWVGCQLRVFNNLEPWIMNLILCLIVAGATEITSNTATATLLMPIMAELAINIGEHPLYLMVSSAISCSFAFMLPVATPPNAIVFSTGYLRISDMALAGLLMNIIAVAALTLAINTWGVPLFGLESVPDIFKTTAANTTLCDRTVDAMTESPSFTSTMAWP